MLEQAEQVPGLALPGIARQHTAIERGRFLEPALLVQPQALRSEARISGGGVNRSSPARRTRPATCRGTLPRDGGRERGASHSGEASNCGRSPARSAASRGMSAAKAAAFSMNCASSAATQSGRPTLRTMLSPTWAMKRSPRGRQHRHPHQQRLAGGGGARCRGWDRGRCRFRHRRPGAPARRVHTEQRHPLLGHAEAGEARQQLGARLLPAQHRALDGDARRGNPLQHPRPQADGVVVDLVEVVEAAEGHMASGERRERRDRVKLVGRREAEIAVGQPPHLFRKQLLLRVRRHYGIGQDIIHGRQAGGTGIAEPGRRDRRRLAGEGTEPPVAGVAGKVDQHVDAVRDDHVGERVVVHQPRRAASSAPAASADRSFRRAGRNCHRQRARRRPDRWRQRTRAGRRRPGAS